MAVMSASVFSGILIDPLISSRGRFNYRVRADGGPHVGCQMFPLNKKMATDLLFHFAVDF